METTQRAAVIAEIKREKLPFLAERTERRNLKRTTFYLTNNVAIRNWVNRIDGSTGFELFFGDRGYESRKSLKAILTLAKKKVR